jgi:hypothetical protein
VLPVKLLLEPADHVVVGMQECLPGSKLGLAEFGPHDFVPYHDIICTYK